MVKISGWESKTLGTLINEGKIVIQTGPFGTVLSAKEFVKYGIPVVAVREIREGYIQIFDETPCVSMETYNRLSKYNLTTNDLVFARKGNVERSALIPLAKTKYFLGSDGICLRVITKNLLPQYLFYAIQSNTVRSFLIQNAYGTTMAGLNEKILSSIPLFLPVDIDEQSAIAETFSDVDRLISSLQKLIEKKKAIKQGAMQELLTGKKRLPGFSGEWRTYKLGELGSFDKGCGISRAESNTGNFPAVRYGELYTKHTDYVKQYYSHISDDVAQTAKRVTFGDILFAASGETKEEIGVCAAIVDRRDIFAGGDIVVFTPTTEINPIFFGTLLNMSFVQKQKSERGQGDAVVHIHADSLSEIIVSMPEKNEQEAIAAVIKDFNDEIEQLEKKLVKYQQIKQGMMQELLTGHIRLKEGENNA